MSEISFTPITWRNGESPSLDAANLNRIEECLSALVEKANAHDKRPHIRYVEKRYENVTIPNIGYISFASLLEGPPELAEGENVVNAQIYNWGTISPAGPVSIGPRYIFGNPSTNLSFVIVYFTIAKGGW